MVFFSEATADTVGKAFAGLVGLIYNDYQKSLIVYAMFVIILLLCAFYCFQENAATKRRIITIVFMCPIAWYIGLYIFPSVTFVSFFMFDAPMHGEGIGVIIALFAIYSVAIVAWIIALWLIYCCGYAIIYILNKMCCKKHAN